MYKTCEPNAEALVCAEKIENNKEVYYQDDTSNVKNELKNRYSSGNCPSGYYNVQDVCSLDGNKYVYCAECQGSGKDMNGKPTPGSLGWKFCSSTEVGVGESYKCNDRNMYKACVGAKERVVCNGNYTEDSRYADKHCPDGKTFVAECQDNSEPPVTWGHCK